MFKVVAYTDGACSGNPGVGGYAGIIQVGGKEIIVADCSVKTTTNNKMELTAVLAVIRELNKIGLKECKVQMCIDSQYIKDCASHREKAWYEAHANKDIWFEIISTAKAGKHKISFKKVKAHSGDPMNERVDKLAKEQCIRAKHLLIEK
jgi:ribonuclease HI